MRRIASFVVAGLLTASSYASAQTSQVLGRDWEDVVSAAGVKVGEGTVLHPVAGAETGIVSNVFYEDTGGQTAGVLRVFGEIAIANVPEERRDADTRPEWTPWRGNKNTTYDGPFFRSDVVGDDETNAGAPPKLEFRAGARAFYEELLSGSGRVRAQRNLGINGNVHAHINPYGTVPVTLDYDLTRDIRPTNFESSEDLARWISNFRFGVRLQTGGRAIVPELRYTNRIDYFESTNSRFANRIQHNFGAKVNWWLARFTQFYADASIGVFSGLGSDADGFKNSSLPLRLRIGTNTALTEKLSSHAYLGFGKGFYSAGQDFTNVLANIGLRYRINPFGRIGASYTYDFADSINANFYSEHRLEGRITQQIRRLLLTAKVGAYFRKYQGIPMDIGEPTRSDLIFATSGIGKYLVRDWLAITGTVQLVTDQTDFRTMVGDTSDDPSYTRFEIFAGVAAAF